MRPFLALFTTALLQTLASASPITIYGLVATNITGAQTQIDSSHIMQWSFEPSVAWSLAGGELYLKAGSRAIAPITLTLWQGAVGTGTAVDEVTLLSASFTQSFSQVDFQFTSADLLIANQQYSLALTSTAVNGQRTAYFIKGSGWTFADSSGNPLPSSDLVGSIVKGSMPVPEPSTWLMLMTGVGFAATARAIRYRVSPYPRIS